MRSRHRATACLTMLLAAAATIGSTPAQTAPQGFAYEPVVTGLTAACSMAFAPDGRLFVLERTLGEVRVIEHGVLQPQPWWSVGYTANPVTESGLLGIAIDPDFLENRYVYLFYTVDGGAENVVARLVDQNGLGVQHTVLTPPGVLTTHPYRIHNGGAMEFDADGKLLVSAGDTEDLTLPQDPASWCGKILRFSPPDLTYPADNPYANSPVWALGLRNTFGLALHPTKPFVFGGENGYLGGDEINHLVPYGNYGWPLFEGPNGAGSGFDDPALTLSPAPVMTGQAFYAGDTWTLYHGDLFVCEWLQGQIRRMTIDATASTVTSDQLFSTPGHMFDVDSGPDGNLWVLHGNLPGGNEIGYYRQLSAPPISLNLQSVSGPSLGGNLTLGANSPAGSLVVPWLSLSELTPPVPTPLGDIAVPLDVSVEVLVAGADGKAYTAFQLPASPTFVGTDVFAQAVTVDLQAMVMSATNPAHERLR